MEMNVIVVIMPQIYGQLTYPNAINDVVVINQSSVAVVGG